MRHEYTVILQYLYHRFLMPDCEVGNELEMQAINEMQHLGWLAEKLQGMGGTTAIEHAPIEKEDGEPDEMLEADIRAERAVYGGLLSSQIPEIEDPGLKALITRIRDHEIYHGQVFSGLLAKIEGQEKKAEEQATPAPKPEAPPTVGSLLGQNQ